MVISDQRSHLCSYQFNSSGAPRTVPDGGTASRRFWPLHWPVMPPAVSLFWGLSIPWEPQYENRPINNPKMGSKHSNERKSCASLILSQKLELIKLRGVSHVESSDRPKGRPLGPNSHVVNVKGKFSEEVTSAAPVNTLLTRKQTNLVADMEKVLLVWIEDQTCHNILLSQSLIWSKAYFKSLKAEWGEEVAEEKSEASRGSFMRF